MSKTTPGHYDILPGFDAMALIAVMDSQVAAAFAFGNCLKYVTRAGRKAGESAADDLGKALWYLNRIPASGWGERGDRQSSIAVFGVDPDRAHQEALLPEWEEMRRGEAIALLVAAQKAQGEDRRKLLDRAGVYLGRWRNAALDEEALSATVDDGAQTPEERNA